MFDSVQAGADRAASVPEATQNLSHEVQQAAAAKPATNENSSEAHVANGTLPSLAIDGAVPADKSTGGFWSGAWDIAKDLGEGAYKEVTEHPLQVAETAVVGAAIGAAAVTFAPVAVVAGAAGAIGAGYMLVKNGANWVHDAKVVGDSSDYSQSEVNQAHAGLQGLGGTGALMAAGMVGFGVGGYAASAVAASAEAGAASAGADSGSAGASSTEGSALNAGSLDHPATPPAGADALNGAPHTDTPSLPGDGTRPVDAPATAAGPATAADSALKPVEPAGTSETAATTGDAAKPAAIDGKATDAVAKAAEVSPEDALANSIKANQEVFTNANQEGGSGVIESTKQLYDVRFQKVTDPAGQKLVTLENRDGIVVPQGSYIATRLDASGNPDIEDGITNSWSMGASKIAKTYVVDPKVLADSDNFVAPTNVDGPSVHMVKMDKPFDIVTPWGQMSGKAGDYLSNYDYDAATGTPGKDYAIVTARSYSQTYQPVGATADALAAAPAAASSESAMPAATAETTSAASSDATAAKPTLASMDEASDFQSFQAADTSFSVKDPELWSKIVSNNNQSDYSNEILRFSNDWATRMQNEMAAGQPMTAEMVNSAERAADTSGITGFMYSAAKQALIQTWQYGDQLADVLKKPDVE